ncbi:long-chain-acyl-CoA synthetase [Asticcacaulis benevestitus]|uniref:Acyl-CoA synthetase n=1 Tax=Asticcacaulis benevestitus DSM 16100 = ATCC BAA-896 TaxID=1121022 RepID=V4NYI7_9CAUL|nr:long-chain-acyl-CoA synthetase [Asticcacaulis benevestitus]ESQ86837.1 acyl-CoA synthetase [Asticcacaulis benevestitus DSM 16100 = ATCC BAA-896]
MRLVANIKRDFVFLKRLIRILRRIKSVNPDSHNLVCDDFEAAATKFPTNTAITFEGKSLTYQQLDTMANRYAHWGRQRGLKPGDTVALFLPNRLDYLAIWIGLNKIGVVSALINNSLTGPGLAHCINISVASLTIVDQTTRTCFEEIESQVERHQALWVLDLARDDESENCRSLDAALKGVSSVRPDREFRSSLTAHSVALYIYTSGTTGLPKAAKISNARAQLYMKAFAGLTSMKPDDKLYCVLPLYHSTGGLCAIGAALLNGAGLVLKRKFSASQFWSDVRSQGITHIVYIGELCRYLTNSPPAPNPDDETKHKVRMVFGNGMRPEVWDHFKARFRIKDVLEFYGSTEGNVSLFNLDGHSGAIARVPKFLKKSFNVRLVRFDVESEIPDRQSNGLCYECKPGEIGEAIGQIAGDARHAFSGYADKAASQKKILTDVFKKGDQWFRTGDLMKQDKAGYLYFIDRIGDTFRWKGENVSTSEVAEYSAAAPGVEEAIIYGVVVPNQDGKAGMASLITREGFDLKTFKDFVDSKLPTWARPKFIRLLHDAETTGTFKYKKMDLIKVGYDITLTTDPIYVCIGEDFVPLTAEILTDIAADKIRF